MSPYRFSWFRVILGSRLQWQGSSDEANHSKEIVLSHSKGSGLDQSQSTSAGQGVCKRSELSAGDHSECIVI